MARFQIFRDKILIKELLLEPENVYLAGRKETCDIILDQAKGISREHFKIIFVDGCWLIDLLSKYEEIFFNGEKVNQINLNEDTQFSIPPFEFKFFLSDTSQPVLTSQSFEANLEKTTIATVVNSSSYVPYVKIMNQNHELNELVRLESGNNWQAGRDSSCNIQIRDLRVSRQQFEIQQIGSHFFILDSGSVNGTYLNGSRVSSSEPEPLKSGDVISVLDNYFYFELHDEKFQERLRQVNYSALEVSPTENNYELEAITPADSSSELIEFDHEIPQSEMIRSDMIQSEVISKPRQRGVKKSKWTKNHKLVGGLFVIILLFLFLIFDGSSKKSPKSQNNDGQTNSSEFSKLPREKQLLIKQSYQLAKNLYIQQKFQLAQTELDKIAEYIKDDHEINQLTRLVAEGMALQQQVRANEIAEQQKLEMEQKIVSQLEVCKKKINPNITTGEIEDCLSPVMPFNPEHPGIMELKGQVELIVMNREAKEAERALYQEKVSRLRGLFRQAETIEKQKDFLGAIKAYEKVILTQLPDPYQFKNQSRGRIEKIKNELNQKINQLNKSANQLASTKMLKQAILMLKQAKKIDPDNQSIDDRMNSYILELKNSMAVLYQEAVLEENFGNVEGSEGRQGAKQKWKKIIDLDIDEGEYFRKAKIKLKKYGD